MEPVLKLCLSLRVFVPECAGTAADHTTDGAHATAAEAAPNQQDEEESRDSKPDERAKVRLVLADDLASHLPSHGVDLRWSHMPPTLDQLLADFEKTHDREVLVVGALNARHQFLSECVPSCPEEIQMTSALDLPERPIGVS